MKRASLILFILITFFACQNSQNTKKSIFQQELIIDCTDSGCNGTYAGPEFIDGSDVAHQFSNTISKEIGDHLKELYKVRKYSKVDFSKIEMSTKGMGSGKVTFKLSIPFIQVTDKSEAYTCFDHCGGWNHTPEIDARKKQLSKLLLPGEALDISPLKTTPEGLQEYWIQWRAEI